MRDADQWAGGGIGIGLTPIPKEVTWAWGGGIGIGLTPIPKEVASAWGGGIGIGLTPIPAKDCRTETLLRTTKSAHKTASLVFFTGSPPVTQFKSCDLEASLCHGWHQVNKYIHAPDILSQLLKMSSTICDLRDFPFLDPNVEPSQWVSNSTGVLPTFARERLDVLAVALFVHCSALHSYS